MFIHIIYYKEVLASNLTKTNESEYIFDNALYLKILISFKISVFSITHIT